LISRCSSTMGYYAREVTRLAVKYCDATDNGENIRCSRKPNLMQFGTQCKCGQVTYHCRKERPYRTYFRLFLNVLVDIVIVRDVER